MAFFYALLKSKDRSLRQLLQGDRILMQELPKAAIF